MTGITIFLEYYIDGECRNNFLLKREAEMKYNIKKKRKTSKDMDCSNSARVFKPLASRVMDLSIKCTD